MFTTITICERHLSLDFKCRLVFLFPTSDNETGSEAPFAGGILLKFTIERDNSPNAAAV